MGPAMPVDTLPRGSTARPGTAGPLMATRDLAFEYGTTRALDAVSFDIAPGTITALVGPNGAGKTTLLRCLAVLSEPVAGTLVIDGVDALERPHEAHGLIGFLPDTFGLYDALTVRRCLWFSAAAHKVPKADRPALIERTAQRLGLTDRLDQRARALSRGLRQRVAIGQTLIYNPRILLLDEPAAGLDPEARSDLSRLLTDLRNQGITLIVSSHILTELEDYSTDMLIMDRGRVVEHTPIRGAERAQPGRRLTLRLATPDDRLAAVLGGFGGVADVAASGETASFVFHGDAAGQAVLLRDLIGAGLPVVEISEIQQSMQDLYLDRLGRRPRTAGARP